MWEADGKLKSNCLMAKINLIFVVRRVGKRFGMKEVGEDEDWSLFWTDYSVALERCMDMKRYQVWIDSLIF